jgi:hypothetical protein
MNTVSIPNHDIQQIEKLAGACLAVCIDSTTQPAGEQHVAIASWVEQCKTTIASMGVSEQLRLLKNKFSLSDEMLAFVCFVILPEISAEYADFYEQVTAGRQRKPVPETIAGFITTTQQSKKDFLAALSGNSPLLKWNLLVSENPGSILNAPVSAAKELIDFIQGLHTNPPEDLLTPCTWSPLNLAVDSNVQAIHCPLQIIRGGFEERQLTVAIRLAKNYYNRMLYRLNFEIVKADENPAQALQTAFNYALLQNALLYWQDALTCLAEFPALTASVNEWIEAKDAVLFAGETITQNLPNTIKPHLAGTIELRALPASEEPEVWMSMANSLVGKTEVNWASLSARYTLNMKRIGQTLIRVKKNSESATPVDTQTVQQAYLTTSPETLAGIAKLQSTTPHDPVLVVSDVVQRKLRTLHTKYLTRHTSGVVSPGVLAIFEGITGNGKTLAAETLAADLKLPLYRIQYSRITGSHKNKLQQLFTEAEQNSAVLLFDEADALFASKSAAGSSDARITAQLIQCIEQYNCMVLLTTNALNKIDAAFIRRAEIITFSTLTPPLRYQLFTRQIAAKAIKTDCDKKFFSQLSQLPFSGRTVKRIIANAFIAASANDVPAEKVIVKKKDFIQAIQKNSR